MKTVGYSCKTI